jgi:predicted flap endonuclease-1-like 5' DNA nuclease
LLGWRNGHGVPAQSCYAALQYRRCIAVRSEKEERVMALLSEFPGSAVIGERAEQAFRMPMGAASPLWAMFGAAAGVGLAYWWMTGWTRLVNVEAFAGFAAQAPAEPAAAAPVEIAAESVPAEVVEAVAVEPAAMVEAVIEAEPDDLTRMTGVGPKLAAALAARGVTRFAQIAAWTADDLAEVDVALALKGRAVREAWVDQAKRFAAGA